MTAQTKLDRPALVKANAQVAQGFYRMELACPEVAKLMQPGQFFQLRIDPRGGALLLRRPFAPSEVTPGGFAFVYAVVGEGTEEMTRIDAGAEVQILGPLGNGYALPEAGSRALLVGGGCGTPSLRFLANALTDRGVDVYTVIGARSACTLLEEPALRELSVMIAVATDDGTAGVHGHAVDAARILLNEIEPEPKPALFACGPHPMLNGLATLAEERDFSCQVSLEERMACGFGACMGCAVAVRAENEDGFVYKRVCYDGPVFDSRELVW